MMINAQAKGIGNQLDITYQAKLRTGT